jgi:hypothetical protein
VKNSHLEIQELIQRSLQEQLSPAEHARVSNHLATCADCVVYRYELSLLEDRLPRALNAEYPEQRISRAQMAQVMYQHRTRTRRSQLFERFTTLAQQAAFATAGVALVAALAILAAHLGPRPAAPQIQPESPAVAAVPENLPLPAGAAPQEPQGEVYNSDMFAINIQVPPAWQLVQQDTAGETFSGADGFVKLATMPLQTGSLEQACAAEARSQPDLYGEEPQINRVVVQDLQACLITANADEPNNDTGQPAALLANALVVEDTRREPEERFWVLTADSDNFDTLTASLEILPEEEEMVAAEAAPEPVATPVVSSPQITVTSVEVDPEGQVRLSGQRTNMDDEVCIKSELHIGELAPEWWPRDNCATLLPDDKWEIVVVLNEINPPTRIDPQQQNRFKVYWPGGSETFAWAYYPQAWAGLTLEEHVIVAAETDSPFMSGIDFKKRIPAGVLEKHAELRNPSQAQALEDLNLALEPFGYRIEASERVYRLFRDVDLLTAGITTLGRISVNDEGSNFVLGFEDSRATFLLQRDGAVEWNAVQHFFTWPVYVGNDLITIDGGDSGWETLNVLRNGEIIFTQVMTQAVENPVRALHSFNGQWVIETQDTVIIDGIDIRQQLEYDKIFHWQPLNSKPFYFFVNQGKVGLAYNGQTLPVQYDQVIHGQCCEPTIFNPDGSDLMVWFYALRDGVWHYIELGRLY